MEYLDPKEQLSDFPKKYNRLVKVVKRLSIAVLILGITILILESKWFFSNEINTFYNFFGVKWSQLTEGYKIFLLGLPATLVIMILGHFINKAIDRLLIKDKK